jgi:hypothetical protein
LADAGKELLFQALADQTKKASVIITYESALLKCSSTFHGLPLLKFSDWASSTWQNRKPGCNLCSIEADVFDFILTIPLGT